MTANVKSRFLKAALWSASFLRLPWLTARILFWISGPFDPEQRQGKNSSFRALVLNSGKDEFFQDLQESLSDDHDFELVRWPSYALRSIAAPVLDRSLRHNKYLTNDVRIETTKANYRLFLKSVWRHYRHTQPIDVVIGANFGYCVQRELAWALEELNTPFVILQKENLNASTPERRNFWHKIYQEGRGKFGGRKILVYNDLERDLEISSGVASPNQVEVTGMPRMDRLHRWRRKQASEHRHAVSKDVLFFAFSHKDKLPVKDHPHLSWGSLCADTHRAILELAQKNPETNIIVKTKGISRQDSELGQMLDSSTDTPPANFHIVSGGDAYDLIIQSKVIVGFNTTGLLEALALGKPVVVPHFAEALDPVLRNFMISLGDSVQYAESSKHLQDLVMNHVNNPPDIPSELPESIRKALRHWVGNDDGQAGRRVREAVHNVVKGLRQ